MKYKTTSFIKLLEAVIKTDVKFVYKALEDAKKKIQRVEDPDDDFVVRVLENELNKYKGKQFDGIKFILAKKLADTTERQKAVHINRAESDNDGFVELIYTPGLHEVFAKDFLHWKVFTDVMAELLSHEFVHIIQFDKIMKKYKNNPKKYVEVILSLGQDAIKLQKEYLSQKLEIMSFARTAVQEFKSHGFSNEDIIKYIKNFSKADLDDSFTLYVYCHFFDKNDKILKKFLQHIYDYVK